MSKPDGVKMRKPNMMVKGGRSIEGNRKIGEKK